MWDRGDDQKERLLQGWGRVRIKLGDKSLQGRVIAVIPLSSLSLSQHVGYSGFQSVEEWMDEAERLHKDRIDEEKFEIVVVKIL